MNGILKRMCLMIFLVSGSVSIAAGADAPYEQSRPSEPTKAEENLELFIVYYRAPDPAKIDAFLKCFDAVQTSPQATPALFGFFYEVFRANPDRVPGWLATIAKFRREGIKQNLQMLAAIAVPECRKSIAGLPPQLPSPEVLERLAAVDLCFCWGRFFAIGDPKHVNTVLRRALSAKDRNDETDTVAFDASRSLFSFSREFPEVEKIFRELLAKCSDDEVKFLFDSVEVPERERLLGKERAAKLPPPVKEKSERRRR